MGFNGDLMGFNGDLMGLNGDLMGLNGDLMVISMVILMNMVVNGHEFMNKNEGLVITIWLALCSSPLANQKHVYYDYELSLLGSWWIDRTGYYGKHKPTLRNWGTTLFFLGYTKVLERCS